MNRSYLAPIALLSIVACSLTSANSVVPTAYQIGCAAISIANGDFLAVSPALVVAGKLTQADIEAEKALFAVDEARCKNPPADIVTAASDIIADAATIYLMLTPRQSVRRLNR